MGRTDMEKEDLYEVNKNDNTKRLMLSAICVLMLLVIALCVYLLLFIIKKAMIIRRNSPLQLPKARSSPLL